MAFRPQISSSSILVKGLINRLNYEKFTEFLSNTIIYAIQSTTNITVQIIVTINDIKIILHFMTGYHLPSSSIFQHDNLKKQKAGH